MCHPNKEKAKGKNFMMTAHKREVREKKKSLREKQVSIRDIFLSMSYAYNECELGKLALFRTLTLC